mmetsp:Transcript_18442/g.27612  ORF Transcript_18442/g.27612 Transcript_18442/m.27612 type:complete len:87 (-) Transcript_18442:429-689(-)
MLVRILERCRIFSNISRSVPRSREDVASSNITTFGFFRRTLAIAILCFSPPESLSPLSPTIVSYPFSIVEICSCRSAAFAAVITSS